MLLGAPQLPKQGTRNNSWQRYWFLWAVWLICPPEGSLPSKEEENENMQQNHQSASVSPKYSEKRTCFSWASWAGYAKEEEVNFFYHVMTGGQSWTSHQPPSPRNAQREACLMGSPQKHLLTVWHSWVFCALSGGEDYHFKILWQRMKSTSSVPWAPMFTRFVLSDYLKSRLHLEHRVSPLYAAKTQLCPVLGHILQKRGKREERCCSKTNSIRSQMTDVKEFLK